MESNTTPEVAAKCPKAKKAGKGKGKGKSAKGHKRPLAFRLGW